MCKWFRPCKMKTILTCTLADLGSPPLVGWISLDYGKQLEHETSYVRKYGYPSNAIVIVKECERCRAKECRINDGMRNLYCNTQYIGIKINEKLEEKKKQEEILKKREEDRLLNYGNPEYAKSNALEEENEKLKVENSQLKNKIQELQGALDQTRAALTESQKNDGIWSAIPQGSKIKLVKKYGHLVGVKLNDVI